MQKDANAHCYFIFFKHMYIHIHARDIGIAANDIEIGKRFL